MAEYKEMPDKEFAEFARGVLEALHYLVAVDKEGKIVYLNDEYARSLGVEKEEVLGKPVLEMIPWSSLPYVIESGIPDNGSINIVYRENGFTVRNVCSRLPVYKEGEIVGAIGYSIIDNFKEVETLYKETEAIQSGDLNDFESDKANAISRLIGTSKVMKNLRHTIEKLARSAITVCIMGETGTGKELIADAIHRASDRSNRPFIKLSCAAIPKELLESELFGYEAGAFTGATKYGKQGKFENANGGTILLDEIGEMPYDLQGKLLRVLQEKEIERVGGLKPIPLDVRVLSSTNRNLWDMVQQGTFRSDLYYRLNAMEVYAPPLRDRMEDIPLLCKYFVSLYNRYNQLNIMDINEEVYTLFRNYSWPGNVRELQHTIERACVLQGAGELRSEHFNFLIARMTKKDGVFYPTATLRENLDQTEREVIISALLKANGNKSAAARILNINRTVLHKKLKQHNINVE